MIKATDDESKLDSNLAQLFLSAIEDGDQSFPWKERVAEAVDSFESIPFAPPTPIDLDGLSDVDSSNLDVLEIVDIDSVEELEIHSSTGIVNLED